MSKLPLCSSDEILAALRRAGFKPAFPSTKGSHRSMSKVIRDRTITTIVILGKREVPRGTLRGILHLAGIKPTEFLSLLGRRKRPQR